MYGNGCESLHSVQHYANPDCYADFYDDYCYDSCFHDFYDDDQNCCFADCHDDCCNHCYDDYHYIIS